MVVSEKSKASMLAWPDHNTAAPVQNDECIIFSSQFWKRGWQDNQIVKQQWKQALQSQRGGKHEDQVPEKDPQKNL